MSEGKQASSRMCVRRDFYPCNAEPTSGEAEDFKARSKEFDDFSKDHTKRIKRYLTALDYIAYKKPGKVSVTIAVAAFVLFWVAVFIGMKGPYTNILLNGFQLKSGVKAMGPTWHWMAVLSIQGALGAFWATWMVVARNRTKAYIDIELYKEWTKNPELTNDQMEKVVLPRYKTRCPYDPTQVEFELVLGEYYDNPGHKLGPVAEWYTVPFKGLATGGTAVFGVTGSGKTASILKNFMRQYFSWQATTNYDPTNKGVEKLAGLVLDPKGSLCADLFDALKKAGLDPVLDFVEARDPSKAVVHLSPLPYKRQADHLIQQREDGIEERERRIRFLTAQRPDGFAAEITKLKGEIEELKGEVKHVKDVASKGEPLPFDLDVFESYRGRADDYIELGFDEFKVKNIFNVLNKIQESKNALVDAREVRFDIADFETFDSHYVPSRVAIRKSLLELMVSVNNFMAALFVASTRRTGMMRQAKDAGLNPEALRMRREAAAASPDPAKKEQAAQDTDAKQSEGIRLGTIGYQGDLTDMDAYANMRQYVRVIAPTKERPGEDESAYRLRWLSRETRLVVYASNMRAISDQVVDCAQRVLMTCGNDPKLSAFARDIIGFAKLASSPMKDILGPDSLVVDTKGLPKQFPSRLLLENLERVKSHVPPSVLTDLDNGSFRCLTVPKGDLPSPRPVDEETEKKMGKAYAAPDPFIQCVEEVSALKLKEKGIASELRALVVGTGAVDRLRNDVGQRFRSRVLTAFGAGLMNHEEEQVKLNRFIASVESFLKEDIGGICLDHLVNVMAAEVAAYPADWAYKVPDIVEVSRAYTLSRVSVDTSEGANAVLRECYDRAARKMRLLRGWEPRPKTLGAGALHSCLRSRYAAAPLLEVLREVAKTIGAGGIQVEKLMQGFISDVMVNGFLSEVEDALMDGGALTAALDGPGGGLRKAVQELWHDGRQVMKHISECFDHLVPESIQDKMRSLYDGREDESVNPPEEELLFDPYPYQSFWTGLAGVDDVCPAVVASWDTAWAAVLMKRLNLAVLAAPADVPVWHNFVDFMSKLAEYHMQALNMYVAYVAPNSGHRTIGPFQFNPLYLPGMDTANIAKTFVTAIFAATSKGGKSDPFWENASNSLVTNLLTATKIAYGYTTFPILADLIANKERLKKTMEVLEDVKRRPDCTAENLSDIQNVLNWYYGQWETPGMNQGETKANIVATLSVTTQAFLAPNYQLAFAPQREEDISFPGWTWIFKHGRVVGVNLPIEKHPAVAQVVLPLLNKSFQKYIMLRDQQRIFSASLKEDHGRTKIAEIANARTLVVQQIRDKRAWHDVLADLFRDDDYRMDKGLVHALCHPAMPEQAESSILNLLLTHGSVGSNNGRIALDKFLAFLVGLSGKHAHKGYEWYKIDDGCRGAWCAGLMISKCVENANLLGLPSWSRVPLDELFKTLKVEALGAKDVETLTSDVLASRILPQIQKAVSERWREVGFDWENGQHLVNAYLGVCLSLSEIGEYDERALHNINLLGGKGLLLELVGSLPMLTVMLQKDVFTIRVMERLRQDYEVCRAELNEGTVQETLSLVNRVKDYSASIRRIEDELASLPNTERWVCWMVDEAHFYLEGESDSQYASVSRSARSLNTIATQSPASLYSRMDEKACDALLSNFPNRVVLRQADFEEAETCANLLGGKKTMRKMDRSMTESFEEMAGGGSSYGGRGKSSGGSISVSMKESEEWIVSPNLLTEIPALQAFALTWDGGKMREPRRIYMKPDFLYMSDEVRNYPPGQAKRLPKLPSGYKKGDDLFAMSVARLMQLKVIDPSK